MKKNPQARQSSPLAIRGMLDSIEPVEMEKTRIRMRIAAHIDDILQTKGMARIDLARIIGKQPSEVTKWLSGSHNFTVDTLTEIAFYLGVPMDELCRKAPPVPIVHHIRIFMKYPAKAIARQDLYPVRGRTLAYQLNTMKVIHLPQPSEFA